MNQRLPITAETPSTVRAVLRHLNRGAETRPDLHQSAALVETSPGIPPAGAACVCTVASSLTLRTVPVMNIDLNSPIWTIEHVAAAFYVSSDRAHKHSYSPGLPAPRNGFSRNLWLREKVLAWFAGLPPADRSCSKRQQHASAAEGRTTFLPSRPCRPWCAVRSRTPRRPRRARGDEQAQPAGGVRR
jgi:hypothetical protein